MWRSRLEFEGTREGRFDLTEARGIARAEIGVHLGKNFLRDEVILRPYLPDRPAAAQDLTPFFCGGCGIQLGPKDEYLACFFDRETGFRLFEAVLCGPSLPVTLPESLDDQPMVPGFEPVAPSSIVWRPLPNAECGHAEP